MGFLEGIRVVDFGHYIAGPVAAMLLADQGAEVIRIERPGGPSFDTPANATWNRGKQSICLDLCNPQDQVLAKGLTAGADVVIENFRPGVMDRFGLSYEATRALNRGLVYASLPAFGPRDRRRNVQGWEGVVLAAADVFRPRSDYRHMLEQVHTDPLNRAGAPEFTDEPVASMYAALVANVGILAALTMREKSGQGQRVETPLFDSLMQAVGILGMAKEPFRRPSAESFGPYDHQYQCADGRWIHIGCIEKRHAEALAKLLDAPELIELGLVDTKSIRRPEQHQQVRDILVEAFKRLPAEKWEADFVAHGLAGVICRTTEEWFTHPQAQSELLVSVTDPNLGVTQQPVPIVQLNNSTPPVERPAPGFDQHRDELLAELSNANPFESDADNLVKAAANIGSPLAGVNVLDLSIVLAGPACGRTLAELGADVIKINDPKPDRVQFHRDVNRGKRSLLLDLAHPDGLEVFWQLVSMADVIVENFRPGVTEQLGIDYASVRARKPDIVYASMTAFGSEGPWSHLPGYEESIQAATGLQCRFGGQTTPRVWPLCSIHDYGTGLAVATGVLVALLNRSVTGEGQLVEGSLARTAGILQSRDVINFDGKEPHEGAELPAARPQYGLYQCQDRWIFLGTNSRELLTPLLGETVKSTDGFWLQLSEWCRRRPAAEAVRLLIDHGVGAQELLWLNDVMMDPQVVGAGLSVVRDHQGIGLLRTTGPGTWLSESKVSAGRPAPSAGADAASVLSELNRADDLSALIRAGAVGVPKSGDTNRKL